MPAGLTIPDGAITEGGTNAANWTCTAASNVITCTSSTAIAAGGTSTFSYSVNVGLGTAVGTNSITNTANVSGGGEIITTNNSASDPTTIVSPDLTISKSHTPTNFVRGSTGTYTIQVNNSGTAITSGLITVTDTLPIGLRVNGGAAGAVMIGGANSANWTCNSAAAANSATQTVTCTSSLAIPSGNSNTFTFDTQVTAGAINTLTNNVSVAGGGEVNTANNTDSDDTVIIASPNVTFSNYQCGANSNLRTITDWSDSGLPTTYGSGQYSFITPGSGITTTVSSSAPTIRKFADIGIPSPFGNNYLDISNGQESTVTINLSQAIRLQMMVADVDHSKIATIIGFNGTTRVFPQVVARSSFSPVVTNQATVVQIASTGVDSVNIGDFENSSTADVIFNSPVDKIVITNSGGLSGKTLDILNLVACGPSLNINKTTTGGTGSFTFNSTPSNGFDSTVLTTTTVATPVSSGYKYLVAANTATTITETITSGWSLTGASCVDGNSNSITSSLSGNILTLPASSIKLDTTISCSFTNSVSSPPYIALLKSCPTPANCTTAAQLPGTNVTYQIQFTNTGGSSAQSVKFVDNIPANTDYKIGSATNDVGTTGLTISIEYSNDYDPLNPTLATWTYTPVSGGGGASVGYDRLVKAIRWRVTAGSLSNVSPNNVGSVSFITKIR